MTSNIGIIGRARSGKDTAGAWLVENRGYVRVSFADPIREAALRLNPIVHSWAHGDGCDTTDERLADLVRLEGWEYTKTEYPEARRLLQEYGMPIRALDPDFWLRVALAKVRAANDAGSPVVITDVRFPNEADSLRRAGFRLVYVSRPGIPHLDHESEGALTSADAEYVISNRDLPGYLEDVQFVADCVVRAA